NPRHRCRVGVSFGGDGAGQQGDENNGQGFHDGSSPFDVEASEQTRNATWLREQRSSFLRMWLTWVSAVRGLMPRMAAMWRLVRPRAIRSPISRSRAVRRQDIRNGGSGATASWNWTKGTSGPQSSSSDSALRSWRY